MIRGQKKSSQNATNLAYSGTRFFETALRQRGSSCGEQPVWAYFFEWRWNTLKSGAAAPHSKTQTRNDTG
ncbi:MAG: hypothetical protein DME20_12200 [Verrucomicrobia bacterium]|nr:MAG: hypothetical protein DME20_12200 [Verrucomicrobiota bacterium]